MPVSFKILGEKSTSPSHQNWLPASFGNETTVSRILSVFLAFLANTQFFSIFLKNSHDFSRFLVISRYFSLQLFPAVDSNLGRNDLGSKMAEPLRNHLEAVRLTLLNLHKALVDSERITYEQTVGTIQSPNHFLQLLTADPWFAWLQPLSQLIVSIDEAMEAQEPLTDALVEATVKQTRLLLTPSENSEGFPRHYFDALQRDPDVVIAHGDVMKAMGPLNNKGDNRPR